ncbi:hypothetical protein AKJ41_03970 [candidate division MSBL1 archaeon SCGC-AAA259O05]|uniref:Uncharacterized protein n=1 Tax=candidate division MSBL1 archaeon SCGC-AAA259O05 TaxID=1698271 RepID=A0A133V2E9_9EURY|nr:hypothetical protein AKJ41_03970 [candidate division MSBL1 archaeon SCGC-AAA259O05]
MIFEFFLENRSGEMSIYYSFFYACTPITKLKVGNPINILVTESPEKSFSNVHAYLILILLSYQNKFFLPEIR